MEANQTQDAIEIVMSWQGSVLETDLVVRERPRSVFVGNEGAVRFLLPTSLIEGRAALVACEGEPGNVRYFVRAPGNAELLASKDGEVLETSIDASGARSVALEPNVSCEVRIGDFSFFVRPTAQPEEAPAAPIFEGGASRYVGAVLAAHAVMLAAFFFLPPAASALNLDLSSRDARYISAHITPPQSIEELLQSDPGGATTGEAESDSPAPATSAGGEDPEPRVAGGHGRPNASSVRSPGLVTPTTVSNLGTFNVMAAAFEHAGDSAGVWGSEHLTGGPGGPGLFAALAGGGGPGTGGLDMGGTGIGTCRPGEVCGAGTIGVGGFDTRGGDGPGPGTGIGVRGDRRSRVPTTGEVVATTGGLSRETIRRTIRQHMNEVRFCYESELRSNPSLEGRVSLQFMVDASGRVATSSATGAGMSSVASCVSTAARRWTFPASEGPTGVTYPFVFNAGE